MTRLSALLTLVLAINAAPVLAQRQLQASAGGKPPQAAASEVNNVEFEMMTWPEVKAAIEAGKTTALVYTGGTEQRGPQNVNGGHNLMARETVRAIAVRLGNAIALPVLPYTPNNASAQLPGTIGLTNDLLGAILERISEQAIVTGFKTVVLMGDHGGGQPNVYRDTAAKLEAKYAPQGIHVFYCDDVYTKRQADFDAYLKSQNLPTGGHASIPDTSEMLYLGGDKGWVRKELIKTALGDPVGGGGRGRGEPADPNAPPPPPRLNNGISGDARASSVELGKREFEMKIDYAVKQIQALMAAAKPQG
jgi:creatinine amidohydrolase/Fe(II)-dependent formamide hydrolase-like protein